MANKYKQYNKVTRKKQEDDSTLRTVLGLTAVAIVALIIFFVYSSKENNQANNPPAQNDVSQLLQNIPNLEKAAQDNPEDSTAQTQLGNTYYDVGFSYLQNNDTANSTPYFQKAVATYQKALAILAKDKKFDINIQTDMATAAFYGNQPDIADAAFKKAIEEQPDFLIARLNYGIFLRDVKQDKAGAKVQWEYVANQTKDVDKANQAKDLLKTVE